MSVEGGGSYGDGSYGPGAGVQELRPGVGSRGVVVFFGGRAEGEVFLGVPAGAGVFLAGLASALGAGGLLDGEIVVAGVPDR